MNFLLKSSDENSSLDAAGKHLGKLSIRISNPLGQTGAVSD